MCAVAVAAGVAPRYWVMLFHQLRIICFPDDEPRPEELRKAFEEEDAYWAAEIVVRMRTRTLTVMEAENLNIRVEGDTYKQYLLQGVGRPGLDHHSIKLWYTELLKDSLMPHVYRPGEVVDPKQPLWSLCKALMHHHREESADCIHMCDCLNATYFMPAGCKCRDRTKAPPDFPTEDVECRKCCYCLRCGKLLGPAVFVLIL